MSSVKTWNDYCFKCGKCCKGCPHLSKNNLCKDFKHRYDLYGGCSFKIKKSTIMRMPKECIYRILDMNSKINWHLRQIIE